MFTLTELGREEVRQLRAEAAWSRGRRRQASYG
jgi:hypothetical protein